MAAMGHVSPRFRLGTHAPAEPPPPEAEWTEVKFPIKVAQEAAGRGLVCVEGRGLGVEERGLGMEGRGTWKKAQRRQSVQRSRSRRRGWEMQRGRGRPLGVQTNEQVHRDSR